MTKAIWLATAAVCAIAGPALAQTPPDPAPLPASTAEVAQQGVLIFDPAFFAASRPDTALDMINLLPGFSVNGGDTGSRGLAGAAGNVLIDGDRPSSKSDGLESILRRISADSVERIELIRGGAAGIDMQGRAVVANVVLKRSVTVERVFEAKAYLYSDGYVGPVIAGQYSRREGDHQLEAAFNATSDRTEGTSDGFRRRYDTSGALIQDADLELWDRIRAISGTFGWQRPFAGGKLRLTALAERDSNENQQTLTILSGTGSDSFNDERSDETEIEVGLNWTRDLSSSLSLEVIALQRNGFEDYTGTSTGGGDTETFTSDATSGESIGRVVLRFRPNDRWSFEGGGEAAYNVLDNATAFAENGVSVPLPSSSVKVEELRGEAFGQATWRPGPRLTVEAGLRIEVSEISQSGDSALTKSFVYPKPRAQLTWTPLPGHQFRLRAEREVGQLNFGDFIASAELDIGQVEGGNPDLEPQKSTVIEAVYERRFWDKGVFEITARHTEAEDVVDIIPLAGGFDGVGNIGDGTEDALLVKLTLPMDRLGLPNARLQAQGNWSKTQVVDPVTSETRRSQGNQGFGCEISFDHDLQGGRWAYGFEHGCNRDNGRRFRVREVRQDYTEPSVTLYGQWKPRTDLTVRVDLGNATDRVRGFDRDIYTGPRDISPVLFRETRRTQRDPFLFVQVRQSF